MAASAFKLVWMLSTLLKLYITKLWLCGSQFPQISSWKISMHVATERSDPRVEQAPKACSQAHLWAKIPGEDHAKCKLTWIRKRAFGRPCRRALAQGGTMYRGQWWTSAELMGARRAAESTDSRHPIARQRIEKGCHQKTSRRLKIMTYNVSGITAELYDTLCHWL